MTYLKIITRNMEYTHQNYNNEDIDIQNMDDSYKIFFIN